MRKDKEKAISLRKLGLSYRAIRKELGVPMGTISGWFANEEWSKEVRKRLSEKNPEEQKLRMKSLNQIRGNRLEVEYQKARDEAKEELRVLKYDPLFIAGMMLYWGEGDKPTRGKVRLANSDPEMIAFYVQFLKRVCKIPPAKIRASVIIYPDLDEVSNRRFWSFATGLPLGNFTKSTVIQGKHKEKKLRYGVCTILVSSTYFKEKVLIWLKELPKQLIDGRKYENIGHNAAMV